MDEKLLNVRQLCLDQAQSFIEAAARLGADWPHIVYHLSLLALEEVGKASMLGARMINHANLDRDRSFTGRIASASADAPEPKVC